MKTFFKILCLVTLTTTHGFTAERLMIDLLKPGFRVTSRMAEHVQPLRKEFRKIPQLKQKTVNRSLYSSTNSSKRRVLTSVCSSTPFIQKRFYTTSPVKTEQIVEDHSQTFAIPTYDGTFKYIMHEKPICLSFLNTFIPNAEIVDVDYLDSHLRPFKEYHMARTFINDEKSQKVVGQVNGFVTEQGAKDESFSVTFMDENRQKTTIADGGWFIRGLSDIYGDIVKHYPKPERNSQVDILCRTKDSYTLVEVQVIPQDYWDQRALAYAANVYGRQLKEGGKWKDIKKVICVNLLGGGPKNLAWPRKGAGFTRYAFKDQNNIEIEEGIEILQYPLFHAETKRIADEKGQKKKAYLEWLDFFEHASKKKEEEVKNSVTTEEIRMAYEKIKSSNLPQEVIEENEQQDATFFERYSQHTEYLKEQAKAERNIEIARNMIK